MSDSACCKPQVPSLNIEDQRLAQILEVFANPIRLAILRQLAPSHGTVCVCEIEAAVPVKQPTVSHHLRLLREAGLIEGHKQGQWVYYRLVQERVNEAYRKVTEFYQCLEGKESAVAGSCLIG